MASVRVVLRQVPVFVDQLRNSPVALVNGHRRVVLRIGC